MSKSFPVSPEIGAAYEGTKAALVDLSGLLVDTAREKMSKITTLRDAEWRSVSGFTE